MELYILLALGVLVLLAVSGGGGAAEPHVVYVVAANRRSGGAGAVLGLIIFVGLVLYLLGGRPT